MRISYSLTSSYDIILYIHYNIWEQNIPWPKYWRMWSIRKICDNNWSWNFCDSTSISIIYCTMFNDDTNDTNSQRECLVCEYLEGHTCKNSTTLPPLSHDQPWSDFKTAFVPWTLKRTSTVHAAISVKKRVAITIWRLGTNVELSLCISSELGYQLLMHYCMIVQNTCKGIVDVLLKKYTKIREYILMNKCVAESINQWQLICRTFWPCTFVNCIQN